tara:strand:+ start:2170 stop:2349 length:180 start_codon:yes stop_codon:yes gene_type:complete
MTHSKIPEEGTEEFNSWLNDQEAKREEHLFLEEKALMLEREGRADLLQLEMEATPNAKI